MVVRVGVDESVDDALLKEFGEDVHLVRMAPQPDGELDVEFWIPTLSPQLVQAQLQHLKGLRVVQAPWAGVDSMRHFLPPEIILCDARGVHDIPTAEWAVAAILAMQKCLPFFVDRQTEEAWAGGLPEQPIGSFSQEKMECPPESIHELADATVLIVGYGSIGKAIESRLSPFGAKFSRIARSPREGVDDVSQLDERLSQADVVVLTLPLTSETKRMLNRKRLANMRPGALLVNAARGGIVDTEELLRALRERRIRAAVDVTDPEPLPPGHPLWKAPNLLITPHVAGDSANFMRRLFTLAREQAGRYARGEPLLNVVSGEY